MESGTDERMPFARLYGKFGSSKWQNGHYCPLAVGGAAEYGDGPVVLLSLQEPGSISEPMEIALTGPEVDLLIQQLEDRRKSWITNPKRTGKSLKSRAKI